MSARSLAADKVRVRKRRPPTANFWTTAEEAQEEGQPLQAAKVRKVEGKLAALEVAVVVAPAQ